MKIDGLIISKKKQEEKITEYLKLNNEEELIEILPKHENINPFYSIIIPFNNRNNTIKKTIRSIQNQNFKNYEIILVDDNSNDNTMDIVKQLSKYDKRIKIIKNLRQSGPFISRLNGMKIAKGEYIYNIDSDDMISLSEVLEFLYNISKLYNVDTIEFNSIAGKIGDYYKIYETINTPDEYDKILYGRDIINRRYISNGKIQRKWYGFMWTKIIKKEIVKKLIFHFEQIGIEKFKNWYYAEDQYFTDFLRVICNSYLHINKIYHFHYINQKSLTKETNQREMFRSHYKYCYYFYKLIKSYKLESDFLIPNILNHLNFDEGIMFSNSDECKLFYNLISKIKTKNNDDDFYYRNINFKQIIKKYYKLCDQ